MGTLQERASKINNQRNNATQKKEKEAMDQYEADMKLLLQEFEIGFKDYLDLLKTEGITYSAHRQDPRYDHQGRYILFKRGKKSVKMDFSARNQYRYEFVKYNLNQANYGRSVYGNWNKEDFIIYLNDSLYEKEGEEPDPITTADDLRKAWEEDTETPVTNSQHEIDVEYVWYLENRLLEYING